METEKLIKIIEFWRESSQQTGLRPRDVLTTIDTQGPEVIDLVGPRRSGKSSVLKLLIQGLQLHDEYLFLNFEDPFFIENNRPEIIEDLIAVYREHFTSSLKFIFLDEIQEINGWEKVVRKLRDGTDYKIFVTGSSAQLLSGELASALTGRHKSYTVLPLSFSEFLQWRGLVIKNHKDITLQRTGLLKFWHEFMVAGGFPEAVLQSDRELLQEYFFDILQRDVVARHALREGGELERLAVYILTQAAKIISIASLKKTFQLSYAAVVAYLHYLQEAFLVFPLPQFSYSLKTQQKSLKKWYAVDTGLANSVTVRFSDDRGWQLENAVFMELMKWGKELYYYKTKNKREVDFVIKEQQRVTALIQVAWSVRQEETRKRELTSLWEAMDELKLSQALLLTDSDEIEAVRQAGKQITILPAYQWAIERNEKR